LYWQCARCPHQCCLTSDRIFHRSKLPLASWFLATHLLTQAKNDVAALELKRQPGVRCADALLVKHKPMEFMRLAEDNRQLTGRVEIDDAYRGGERCDGLAARTTQSKVPFVTPVQTTEAGHPHLVCFSQLPFTKQALGEFSAESTVLPLTVVCNGSACFEALAEHGADHDRTGIGGGKDSVKHKKLRAVNTVLSNLRIAINSPLHTLRQRQHLVGADEVHAYERR
jgi:hypothetical protein